MLRLLWLVRALNHHGVYQSRCRTLIVIGHLSFEAHDVPVVQRERTLRDPAEFRIAHEFKRPRATGKVRPAATACPVPPMTRAGIRATDHVARHCRRSFTSGALTAY